MKPRIKAYYSKDGYTIKNNISIEFCNNGSHSTIIEITEDDKKELIKQLKELSPRKEQTIKDGSIGYFYVAGMALDFAEEEILTYEQANSLDGKEITIDNLATYSELGVLEHEYYDITFKHIEPGDTEPITLYAISGHHITPKSQDHESDND